MMQHDVKMFWRIQNLISQFIVLNKKISKNFTEFNFSNDKLQNNFITEKLMFSNFSGIWLISIFTKYMCTSTDFFVVITFL